MNTPNLVFAAGNNHSADCGPPPAVQNQDPQCYYGYFENPFGWVFVYHRPSRRGQLRGGDVSWPETHDVVDGGVDLMLGDAERLWLAACWKAATSMGTSQKD